MRQFITSDGTRLAYAMSGLSEGPVAVLCDGISCDGFVWRYLRPALETRFRVLHVHYRGHGRSGLPQKTEGMSVSELAHDMGEVMDHLDLGPALWLGHSMGVQVCLEAALRMPERVRAMTLICGSHGRILDTFKSSNMGWRILPFIQNMTRRFRPAVSLLLRAVMPSRLSLLVGLFGEMNRHLIRVDDIRPYFDHFATMPPDVFVSLLTDAAERTSANFLGRLTMPALVIVGARDGFTPASVGQQLAQWLPESELELLKDGTHCAPLEVPERVGERVMAFAEGHGLLQPAPDSDARPSLAARFRAAREERTSIPV